MTTPSMLPPGTRVEVRTTSYRVTGTVRAAFLTGAGAERYVVEFDQPPGLLHIHSPQQLTPLAP